MGEIVSFAMWYVNIFAHYAVLYIRIYICVCMWCDQNQCSDACHVILYEFTQCTKLEQQNWTHHCSHIVVWIAYALNRGKTTIFIDFCFLSLYFIRNTISKSSWKSIKSREKWVWIWWFIQSTKKIRCISHKKEDVVNKEIKRKVETIFFWLNIF